MLEEILNLSRTHECREKQKIVIQNKTSWEQKNKRKKKLNLTGKKSIFDLEETPLEYSVFRMTKLGSCCVLDDNVNDSKPEKLC